MTAAKAKPGLHSAAVSVATFAAACEMSTSAIRLLIDKGEIHAVRIGRAVRIPVTEFERLGLGRPAFLGGVAA